MPDISRPADLPPTVTRGIKARFRRRCQKSLLTLHGGALFVIAEYRCGYQLSNWGGRVPVVALAPLSSGDLANNVASEPRGRLSRERRTDLQTPASGTMRQFWTGPLILQTGKSSLPTSRQHGWSTGLYTSKRRAWVTLLARAVHLPGGNSSDADLRTSVHERRIALSERSSAPPPPPRQNATSQARDHDASAQLIR